MSSICRATLFTHGEQNQHTLGQYRLTVYAPTKVRTPVVLYYSGPQPETSNLTQDMLSTMLTVYVPARQEHQSRCRCAH